MLEKHQNLVIGNFALSNIYLDGKLAQSNLLGGMGFRVALAFAFFGVSLNVITMFGFEDEWLETIKHLKENNVRIINYGQNQQSIKFDWFYNKNKLDTIRIHNPELMDKLVLSIKGQEIAHYNQIVLCSLGLKNELKVINKVAPTSTISYIFHESNLNNSDAKDYFELFKRINYLFLNEEEAVMLTGNSNIDESGRFLSSLSKHCFITMGKKGALVFIDGEKRCIIPALDIVDIVERNSGGAGDTFAGATIAALAISCNPLIAARLGSLLAGVTIQEYLTEKLINFIS